MKKKFEVRYRQFARGRRSIKTAIVFDDSVENVRYRFEDIRQTAIDNKLTRHRHAQLISVFETEV